MMIYKHEPRRASCDETNQCDSPTEKPTVNERTTRFVIFIYCEEIVFLDFKQFTPHHAGGELI